MHRCKAVKGSEKDFLVNTVTMTVTVKIRTLSAKWTTMKIADRHKSQKLNLQSRIPNIFSLPNKESLYTVSSLPLTVDFELVASRMVQVCLRNRKIQ